MTKTYMYKCFTKYLLFTVLAIISLFIFVGCQKEKTLPQPDYPLSKAELTAALEEIGLTWTIEQTDEYTDGTTTAITYSLHLPGVKEGYNSVSINTYSSENTGRRLQIYFNEPQNKQWWSEEDDACWEDWKEVLILIARLYGGFKKVDDIYRICSTDELSKDTYVLWQGTLDSGYFLMETSNPMLPERFSMGNTLRFNLYESEDIYLQSIQGYKKSK